MSNIAKVLALLLVALAAPHRCEGLRIAAFNVEIFGTSKISQPAVVDTLCKVSLDPRPF